MSTDNPELTKTNSLNTRLVVGAMLAAALSPLGSTSIAVALPDIGRDLVLPEVVLTHWLAVSYLVVSLAGLAPGGRIADRIGHVRALALGSMISAAAAVLGLLATTLPLLAAARIIMAAGGAIVVPSAMALIRSRTMGGRRSAAFGVFSATMAAAAALGPVVGGELIAQLGWRSIFAAGLPLIAISVICLWKDVLASDVRAARLPFDWAGSFLLAAALGSVTTAAAEQMREIAWLYVSSVMLLVLFVVRSLKMPSPVLNPRIFMRRHFSAGCLVIGAQNLAMYALLFELPILFGQRGQVDPRETGRTLLVMMAGMVVFSIAGGWMTKRLGLRRIAFTGAVVAMSGWLLLISDERLTEPFGAVWGLLLLGCGIGLSMAPAQTASMEALGPEMSGMAAAGVSLARYMGAIIGLAMLSWFLADSVVNASILLPHGFALGIALMASILLPARPLRAEGVRGEEA